MAATHQGSLIGTKKKFAVVISRFNEFISRKLLDGCLDALERHGVAEKDVEVYWVPGSFEIPLTARKLAQKGGCDGVIALGTVLRGQTPHFDFIAAECAKGVAQASMETGLPIIFGVITADTLEQAIERAGTKSGNKGADAAAAAIEMANLFESIGK
jgi:6,7-dimethyl-8-ribityllumazine synthase